MLTVLLVGIALVGLLTAYIALSRVIGTTAGSSVDSASGFYAAETGLNLRFDDIFDRFNNRERPSGASPATVDACTDTDTSNDGTDDFQCVTYNVPRSGINPVSAGSNPRRLAATYVVDNTEYESNGEPVPRTIPSGEAFAGLSTLEYSYQLNSVARKMAATPQTEAILSMDIKSRVIPIFQFAAFFDGDLETTRTAPMTLNGRVHSNGSIYFGAGGSSPYLTVTGQVTTPNNIYASSKHDASYAGHISDDLETPIGRVRIADSSGTLTELVANAAPAGTPTRDPMDWDKLRANWGGSMVKTSPLQMPDAGLLTTSGEYFSKADLRITYSPNRSGGIPPFDVTRVDSASTASPRAGTDLDINLEKSLQQPVLVPASLRSGLSFSSNGDSTIDAGEDSNSDSILDVRQGICPLSPPPRDQSFISLAVGNPLINSMTNVHRNAVLALTPVQRAAVAESLYVAILRQSNPVNFSQLSLRLDSDTALRDAFEIAFPTRIGNSSILTSNTNLRAGLRRSTPMQLAALAERSFCSAPIQSVTFQNYRENRNISVLQTNLEALTVWNKDGRTVTWDTSGTTVNSDNNAQGFAVSTPLFVTAPADSGAPNNSFQKLGYAAADTTEAGLVVHLTVACANTSEGCSNTTNSSTSNTSRYGFALVRGAQLMGLAKTLTTTDPTGVTFVSDQAIYTQGDFNTTRTANSFNSNITGVSNKQPAAILADSFNLLSNACMSTNDQIHKTTNDVNCGSGSNARYGFNGTSNISNGTVSTTVTPTEVNAGILSGVDVTTASSFNGGLHNYPRFHERWNDGTNFRVLSYSGSWVNLKTCDPNDATCPDPTAATPNPKRVSGSFQNPSNTTYYPPRREWGYDTSFNAVENLPPLDPRFVYLKQDTFVRNFER
jgi:hypothetical protein